MGMFLPEDISQRITEFIAGRSNFPFIKKEEVIGVFYLFGKDYGIHGQSEYIITTNIAKKTIEQTSKDVRAYQTAPTKIEPSFIRQIYINRALQISIELQKGSIGKIPIPITETSKRIGGDPAILSSCFAQHIALYKLDYFFELFQPFNESDIPT